MCSIYGIMYYKNCCRNSITDRMNKMCLKTMHRGPDENEIVYFENGAIGMNRLSIIGPSYKKAMVQQDKEIYSVLNGEITNNNTKIRLVHTSLYKCTNLIFYYNIYFISRLFLFFV